MTESTIAQNPVEMQEVWKDIPGFFYYQVSNLGRIKSTARKNTIFLRPGISKNRGRVVLCREGTKSQLTVASIVLSVFIGPRPEGMETCHNNGNSSDDRLCNLRWDTKLANAHDRIAHGTNPDGERNPRSKVTNTQATDIRNKYSNGRTLKSLAVEYGIDFTNIHNIIFGKTFINSEGPVQKINCGISKRYRRINVGQNHYKAKLKNSDIPKIIEMIKQGVILSEIAKIYNISPGSISKIKTGRTWKISDPL